VGAVQRDLPGQRISPGPTGTQLPQEGPRQLHQVKNGKKMFFRKEFVKFR
jgi:hypothetical protein